MYDFRDKIAQEIDLLVYKHPDCLNPFTDGARYTDVMKTQALKEAVEKYDIKIANMSTYAEIQALNPKKVVLLGYADIDDGGIILTENEQAEKNFLEEFVFTEEGD